ncbi:hypothetical protein BDA96_02G058500 [Sorghum bicolor]|uniref:Thioredoxin domain-containing protein n=2 Tax=Sorghum bicolor TaxID=4558 RepID=A0A921RKF5_SORBI|nr:thioredoxin H1 [Sorghum bicolor]KAG0541928.1 hypothetical protein BDA96_02G058500 [Sorghum bicolor]KXG34558.1 hypothetical protein SORBI_3002G058100 [Sorghum bicolor]|eukprot:XP_021310361.1 thioredoxin H1 [Sorghum bicolor]
MAGTVIACHTKEEFDAHMAKAYEAGKLVVIDFMSPTCGACQEIAPVFAECAKEYPTKGVFLMVDIFELKEVAHSYCIQAAPTFVFIMDDLTLESFVGASPDKLRNTVKEFIDNTSAASASSSA